MKYFSFSVAWYISAFCPTFLHCKFSNPHCTFDLVKSSIHYYMEFWLVSIESPLLHWTYLYRTEHLFTVLNISLPYWTSLYQTAQAQLNLSKFLIEKSPEQGLNRRWLSSSFGHSALINWATEASTCHQHCDFLFKVLTTLVEILKTSVTGGVWTAVLLIIVMSP